MGEVVLTNNLRVRGPEGGDSWPEVTAQLVVEKDGRFVIMKTGATEVDRVELEVTSSVFETTLGANTFEIVTTNQIVHLSTPSMDVTTTWIKYLRDSISKCDPFPKDPIFKEALSRQSGETYDVKFLDHKPLGIVLERSGEWALVKVAKSDAGVMVGSALCAVDDQSSLLNTYSQTIERLKNWTPPLKLTFRKAPEKKGYLMKQSVHKKNRAVAKVVWKKRFFTLSEGTLVFSDSDSPSSKIMGEIPLMGSAVNLIPPDATGRNCCFKVLSGVSSLVVQADTVNDMFEWACALYYGMAIANGGGYILAMEIGRIAGNKSRKEMEAEGLKKAQAFEDAKLAKEKARRAEADKQEKEEKAEEERRKKMKEEERKKLEAEDAEKAKNRLSTMLGKKAEMDEVMRNAQIALEENSSKGVEQAIDGAANIDRNMAELILSSVMVEEAKAGHLTEEPEPEPEKIVYSERDLHAEGGDAGEDGDDIEPEEHFKVQEAKVEPRDRTADTEDVKKVFAAYAKTSEEGAGYLNVMQFSTIWRLATGVKGNLYKEMQIFNKFDTENKGMLEEKDFIAGWLNVADGPGGDLLLRNLKQLVSKDNLLL